MPAIGVETLYQRVTLFECPHDGVDHPRYLLRLIKLELLERERRVTERRFREARFPALGLGSHPNAKKFTKGAESLK